MALKLRRGTDLERQSVIFEEGELIYTTDTKTLWIGDGQTLGGINVTGGVSEFPISLSNNLDLNGFDIVGGGDIDITGIVVSSGFYGDGSGLTNLPIPPAPPAPTGIPLVEGQEYQIDVRGNVVGLSSALLIDAFTETISAAALTGHANIDVSGSIFADDSTLIVDGMNGSIYTNVFNTDNLIIQKTSPSSQPFEVKVIGDSSSTAVRIVTKSNANLTGTSYSGKLWFGYEDPTGSDVTSGILGGENAMYLVSNASSNFTIEANYLTWEQPGKLGIGTYAPTQELDVRGNAVVSGFVQFGSLTTTERNALTPAAGMVIWNQTTTQFEGFDGTNWINLVNGIISA